eukprot:TRINITY_DN522_c7_g1_i1.p1 TRINITY_DN522_c7_g1~~TRINITY_DN522_c7_g1_i1.p1  ORF type:complete len:553 (-),score=89.54 TRINITY_DN522_c7_g1_i1:152-1810(-)
MAAMSASLSATLLLLSTSFASLHVASGKGFLSAREVPDVEDSSGPAVVLAELEGLHEVPGYKDKVQARASRMEEALKPLFKLAPQDAAGQIDVAAARYVLRRLFLQRHGWQVSGLEAETSARNGTSASVDTALRSASKFSLASLARFASTLETLVQGENEQRLQQAFDVFNYSKQRPRSVDEAQTVIEAYMTFFAMTYHFPESDADFSTAKQLVRRIHEWEDTMTFANEIQQRIFEQINDGEKALSLWDACLQVVEEIGERYGRWQNKECSNLKTKLMQIETSGTGRVPLKDFWGPALYDGNHLFHENAAYLEQIGALEGTAPRQSVIIPNYLYSSANCAAGSKYFNVCCINECNDLLGDIEAHIDASHATPQRLADFMGTLSSSTVVAKDQLSVTLMQRLDEISAHHGGLVPLHSRLFAQLMHHAFPRECPFPHMSSLDSNNTDSWIVAGTEEAVVTRSDIESLLAANALEETAEEEESCQIRWTNEEEMFMQSSCGGPTVETPAADNQSITRVPSLGLLLSVGALMLALWRGVAKLLGWPSKASDKALLI